LRYNNEDIIRHNVHPVKKKVGTILYFYKTMQIRNQCDSSINKAMLTWIGIPLITLHVNAAAENENQEQHNNSNDNKDPP